MLWNKTTAWIWTFLILKNFCFEFCDVLLLYLPYGINQNHKYQQSNHCEKFGFGISNIWTILLKFLVYFALFMDWSTSISLASTSQNNFLKVSLPPFLLLPHPTSEKIKLLSVDILYQQVSVTQNVNKILKSLWSVKGVEEALSCKSEKHSFSNPEIVLRGLKKTIFQFSLFRNQSFVKKIELKSETLKYKLADKLRNLWCTQGVLSSSALINFRKRGKK